MAQMVRNLPAVQETWVQSLGQEDPLEKGMAAPSSTLAWGNPMDRGAWRAEKGFSEASLLANMCVCVCVCVCMEPESNNWATCVSFRTLKLI